MSLVQQLREITGCDEPTANTYIEISNNNLQAAIDLFFEQQAQSAPPVAPAPALAHVPAPVLDQEIFVAPLVEYGRPFSGMFVFAPRAPLAPAEHRKEEVKVMPFKGLVVEAKIVGVTADVSMRHCFVNSEDVPIEAVYVS